MSQPTTNIASFKTAAFKRDLRSAISVAGVALSAFNAAAHQRIAQITEAKALAHGTDASSATTSPAITEAAAALVAAIVALEAVQ